MGDMAKRLKHADGSSSDMQRRIDELTVQVTSAGSDNQRLQAELARLRTAMQELQDKNDALARENKQLSGAFITRANAQQKSILLPKTNTHASVQSIVLQQIPELNIKCNVLK